MAFAEDNGLDLGAVDEEGDIQADDLGCREEVVLLLHGGGVEYAEDLVEADQILPPGASWRGSGEASDADGLDTGEVVERADDVLGVHGEQATVLVMMAAAHLSLTRAELA